MKENLDKMAHEAYCQEMLNKARSSVEAFVFDVDGTIKSSAEPDCSPIKLIEKIISNGKFVGLVTASGVSALEGLAGQLLKLAPVSLIYLGIANGTALYKLDSKGKHELYRNPLSLEEVKGILRAWESVIKKNNLKEKDLVPKGLSTFNKFLEKNWGEYIPEDYLQLSGKFGGKCFVEELKATFVMPKDEVFSQKKFVALMQEEIDRTAGRGKYIIDMGDTTFAHATRKPGMAPKLYALKRIQSELGLSDNQVLAFGDMPFGNDKGLLIDSNLPYTFTNKYFDKESIEIPPFFLPGSQSNPVKSVYKAVDYLLERGV